MQQRKAVVTLILILALSACSLNTTTNDTGDQPPVDEQPTVTASVEPGPPDPTATFTLTLPPPATKPMVSVSLDTNCRTGQGQAFDYLGALLAGETAEVIASDPTGRYYYIRNPDGPGYCWLWAEYADVLGDISQLPVYTPEPTPTPMPSFTYVFNDVVQCVTIYNVELRVTNTGAVTWESFELYTVNTTLGTDDTYSDYRFADCEACGCGYVDYSITPGENGWLGSTLFMDHYPHGESFHTELTMCTKDGLGGFCLTQELNFTVP